MYSFVLLNAASEDATSVAMMSKVDWDVQIWMNVNNQTRDITVRLHGAIDGFGCKFTIAIEKARQQLRLTALDD